MLYKVASAILKVSNPSPLFPYPSYEFPLRLEKLNLFHSKWMGKLHNKVKDSIGNSESQRNVREKLKNYFTSDLSFKKWCS